MSLGNLLLKAIQFIYGNKKFETRIHNQVLQEVFNALCLYRNIQTLNVFTLSVRSAHHDSFGQLNSTENILN